MDAHIDRLLRTASERSEMLTLGAGLPAQELFARAALERAFSAALHAAGDPALQYGWPEGNPGLRATIAGGLRRRHCDVQDDDVIITSGAQQAVAIAVEALLWAGDAIEVDAATYPAT
jgi:2-aminoadipate transaminase